VTTEDWDEIFDSLVKRTRAALDKGAASVSLDDLEERSMVGFYDMRLLFTGRKKALLAAGLAFDGDRLSRLDQEPTVPLDAPSPAVPTVVDVDGQVAIAYTSE
jgi:hypothetical protein